ncbi:helix-turn-helix domain-containing protein [Sphingobacterium psychroaquaticum]|uniref:AraC-type DNA-binding protein n=1 Tax=Sphingobacterium psychroaquaticum TaxID=561061 RepID=A0A1X7JKU7_9SPHI|nr:helix-turn-helix domain-containing protein [Sphingobacterium psychroaquaticum]QBQ40794.1 AraC family transcriptional regulator [Sphingobacterium psychroaquaticum]SMG28811.1 AraC-type DNA-binding protein [Sphingobacterium psychroaquaticum]
MSTTLQTINDYYRERPSAFYPIDTNPIRCGEAHFNINMRKYCSFKIPFNRCDFYKISLIQGTGMFHYGNHAIYIDKPALFIPSPSVPYYWECDSLDQHGFFCLFNVEFLTEYVHFNQLHKTSVFKEWSKPLIFLEPEELSLVRSYFSQMYEMAKSNYPHKYEAIGSFVNLLLHHVLMHRVDDIKPEETKGSTRIYRLFDELLNRQFPLDSPAYPLQLKTPADYAEQLHVHVNHLNASVKAVTNKTTSTLIRSRMLLEAKSLLLYTAWDVSAIGYTLGFDQPSHFHHFFKKLTGLTPLQFRQQPKQDIL